MDDLSPPHFESEGRDEIYGPEYYASHCGSIPYARNAHWLRFFGDVADALVRAVAPRRVFDAGCAIGLLVEAFWDRGVEAEGRDISRFAISQVRADVRGWCQVGSIADPIEGSYDLVTCIEVLEHMPEAEAIAAIRAMAAAAPRVLFSSSPTDLDEPTHVNVRPPIYWLKLWAEAGFAPSVTHDAGYLAPHAYLLERSEAGRSERELLGFADRIRHRVALAAMGNARAAAEARAEEAGLAATTAQAERDAIAAERDALRRERDALKRQRAELARERDDLVDARDGLAAERDALARAREAAIRDAGAARAERDAILHSTAWRLTAPLRAAAGLAPQPLRRLGRKSLQVAWWTMTLQLPARLRARRDAARLLAPPSPQADPAPATPPEGALTAEALLSHRFPTLEPLPVFAVPCASGRRLSVVTDSIGTGSLYGGVGTALILAALSAERMGARLRLVTRTEAANPADVGALLALHGIPWNADIEVVHAPDGSRPAGDDVAISSGDLFLTTSWWTTRSTLATVPRSRIACLVQEDERMFYPHGDEQLRCAETLAEPGFLYLVNTELLLGHLAGDGLVPGATAFEPAFPAHIYRPALPEERAADGKSNFFFYARPHNVRNLYLRGLEAISAALEEGVLDPERWRFFFAGHGAAPVSLPLRAEAVFPGPMAWSAYGSFLRSMELGLSLMYTPHPSYPPLDLAASGAVVVTNRFGPKQDLSRYSRNILCADLDVPSLVAAIRDGVALADDRRMREENFARNGLQRDWRVSMAPAVDRIAAWAETTAPRAACI